MQHRTGYSASGAQGTPRRHDPSARAGLVICAAFSTERREGEQGVASIPTEAIRPTRGAADSKENRWRSFHISEVKDRDFKIDSLKWLKDESLDDGEELPEPEELATDAIAELEAAVEELNAVVALLESVRETTTIQPS